MRKKQDPEVTFKIIRAFLNQSNLSGYWVKIAASEKCQKHCLYIKTSKSNFHHTRNIAPKRATSDGAHLRGFAPGQHSFKETSQWWRAVSDTESALTGPGIKPLTFRTDSLRSATELTGRFTCKYSDAI